MARAEPERWPAFAQSTPTVPPIMPAPIMPMFMMILSRVVGR